MEKGSYHTLKSITLELGVLEIRHLRCDGFFAVHVCGVVVIDTSESGQQSKKKSKLLKLYLLLKLNYRWKSTSYFSKEDKSKKVGHAEIRAVCPATVTVEIFGTNPGSFLKKPMSAVKHGGENVAHNNGKFKAVKITTLQYCGEGP